ncbi:MAG: propanediol utilization microcompartment protein PduB, partial [Eubacteriaceae bacterium]|nr:propanediol utilization microcompartment protein PduB [Eubacteriaceae bacterium]
MKEELMNQLMEEVLKKIDTAEAADCCPKPVANCGLTEFVGTAIGDTIGFVIANVDANLHEAMKLDAKYRSIGILSARTGAGPHIFAADEAVKATNTEMVICEMA